MLRRTKSVHDPVLLMYAHVALGDASYQMGKLLAAREHLEKAFSLYDLERHRTLTFRFGGDVESICVEPIRTALNPEKRLGDAIRQRDQ